MFVNLTQCSEMFLQRIVFKIPLFLPYFCIKLRRELYIFDRLTTSGNNPNAVLT